MLLFIGIVLLILWALGFFTAHITAGAFNVLVLLAIIAIIVHFYRGRNSRNNRF